MATEVENNAPAMDTKEIKEEVAAGDNKAEEAKQEVGAGDAATPKEKEPAPPKVVVHKTNYEKDVVYLYQFSRTPLLPSLSPYCLKVETWLRLAGIKYEVSKTLFLFIGTSILALSLYFIAFLNTKLPFFDKHASCDSLVAILIYS